MDVHEVVNVDGVANWKITMFNGKTTVFLWSFSMANWKNLPDIMMDDTSIYSIWYMYNWNIIIILSHPAKKGYDQPVSFTSCDSHENKITIGRMGWAQILIELDDGNIETGKPWKTRSIWWSKAMVSGVSYCIDFPKKSVKPFHWNTLAQFDHPGWQLGEWRLWFWQFSQRLGVGFFCDGVFFGDFRGRTEELSKKSLGIYVISVKQ